MDGGGWSLDHRPCVWVSLRLLMWLLPCPIPHACNHLLHQCGCRQLNKLLDHFDLLLISPPTSLLKSQLDWWSRKGIWFKKSASILRIWLCTASCSSLLVPHLACCYGFFLLAMASSDRKLAKVGLVAWLRWSACTRNIREWLQTMEKARHNN